MENQNKEIVSGILRVQLIYPYRNIIVGEIWIISILCGVFSRSLIIFLVMLISLWLAMFIKELVLVFIITVSIGWGILIGALFLLTKSLSAVIVMGFLGFLTSFAIHNFSLEYLHRVFGESVSLRSLFRSSKPSQSSKEEVIVSCRYCGRELRLYKKVSGNCPKCKRTTPYDLEKIINESEKVIYCGYCEQPIRPTFNKLSTTCPYCKKMGCIDLGIQ